MYSCKRHQKIKFLQHENINNEIPLFNSEVLSNENEAHKGLLW